MFSFNPDLADDGDIEDGDAVFDSYARSDDEDDAFEYKELDLEALSLAAQEVDGTGTVATNDRLQARQEAVDEEEEEGETSSTQNGIGGGATGGDDATPINENLFLDEDLDGLSDELNDLDVDDSSN